MPVLELLSTKEKNVYSVRCLETARSYQERNLDRPENKQADRRCLEGLGMKQTIYLFTFSLACFGQATISPTCPTTVKAGTNLVCSAVMAKGGGPAGVQLSWQVPTVPIAMTAGAQALAVQKAIACGPAGICIVQGQNQTAILDGEIMIITIPVASNASGQLSIGLIGTVEASPGATAIAVMPNPPVSVSVSPSVSSLCDVNRDGLVDTNDVAQMTREANGTIPQVHDLNKSGLVDVVDVQIAINAALGLPCTAR